METRSKEMGNDFLLGPLKSSITTTLCWRIWR